MTHRLHGIERIDDYDWLRDPAAARETLVAERRHYAAETAHMAPFRRVLAAKMAGRTPETESSVSWRHGAFVYYTQIEAGREFGEFCRKRDASDGGSVLLNLDELADGGFVELGVREVSPCGRYLAYSVDTTGDEVYELRFRDLETGNDLPDRVPGTYYTGAWSADSSSFFYTVVDACYRPYEVRRHVLGETSGTVLTEPDRRFELTVAATRSGAYVTITSANRDTTEVWLIPADDPGRPPVSVAGRRPRVEYRVDHDAGRDRLIIVTDDGFPEFKVVHAPVTGGPWQDLLPADPTERIHRADCFAGYIVLSLRRGGEPLLRVIPLDGGEPWEIHPETTAGRIELVHNHDYAAASVLIETGSYTEPTRWEEVMLATRERTTVKTAETPGYDPAEYVSERHWAPAVDGALIPVTVVRRRDVPLDGTAPCLLYGYGAYEAVFEPTWEAALSVLLDEKVIFAHAHIRGGGELGRAWWQAGRLARKPATFTDHLAVAAWLDERASAVATRGLSAGGLLQAAVYGRRRWSAVVAEVPFVDVVTTMLDDSIPLTVNEWEEWGDPREPDEFAWMLAYSPYDNIPINHDSSPLLVTGAVNDPRVLVHEPAKWVAKLRAYGAKDVLFRVEVDDGGHTGPSGRYAHLDYEAEIYAFILSSFPGSPAAPA